MFSTHTRYTQLFEVCSLYKKCRFWMDIEMYLLYMYHFQNVTKLHCCHQIQNTNNEIHVNNTVLFNCRRNFQYIVENRSYFKKNCIDLWSSIILKLFTIHDGKIHIHKYNLQSLRDCMTKCIQFQQVLFEPVSLMRYRWKMYIFLKNWK